MSENVVSSLGTSKELTEYLPYALERFFDREEVPTEDRDFLRQLFLRSFLENSCFLEQDQSQAIVEPRVVGRELLDTVGELLVRQDSQLFGEEYMEESLSFLEHGGNILLIQNHKSLADTLVTEVLMRRKFGRGATQDWMYIAGHPVNRNILPLLFSSGCRRVQVFSTKFQSAVERGDPMVADLHLTVRAMAKQNLHAMKALGESVTEGGKVVVLYPEGGRVEREMGRGEPRVMKIPDVMAKSSPNGVKVLPTYVDGGEGILPVVHSAQEMDELLEHVRSGTGSVRVGAPVDWALLQKCAESKEAVQHYTREFASVDLPTHPKFATRGIVADTMLALIADLAPEPVHKGAYQDVKLREFVLGMVK